MRKTVHKILVTGAAGFIGSEFVRQAAKKSCKIVVVDKLTYAGDRKRLKEVEKKIIFYKADIANKSRIDALIKKEKPREIIHFAAETHVDRSIHHDVKPFIDTNILGTQNLIDLALKYKIKKFIHISTDEIYGESKKGRFKETDELKPNNPYAATKAAAESLVRAAIRTHKLKAIIIRPANNYGPWQYPEKFVPVIIFKALKNNRVPVYGRGKQIREWLYVSDCAKAIHFVLNKGKIGETYNIGSYFEKENITTAKTIIKLLKKSEKLIQFVKDRPGHDFRYSVDCTKLRKLGWRPKTTFSVGIKNTVNWYINNVNWVENKLHFLSRYWKNIYKE